MNHKKILMAKDKSCKIPILAMNENASGTLIMVAGISDSIPRNGTRAQRRAISLLTSSHEPNYWSPTVGRGNSIYVDENLNPTFYNNAKRRISKTSHPNEPLPYERYTWFFFNDIKDIFDVMDVPSSNEEALVLLEEV